MSAQVLKHSNLRWLKQQMQSLEIKVSFCQSSQEVNHTWKPIKLSHIIAKFKKFHNNRYLLLTLRINQFSTLFKTVPNNYDITQENNSITILLDKWNHLSRPVLESHTNKPTSWASLCSSGIHLVVSGFTQINYNQINNKFDELNWIKCVVTAAKLIIVNYDWRLRIAEVIQHHEPIIRKPYHRSQEINSIIRPLRQNTYLRRGIPTNNEEFWRRKLDS